MASSLVLTSRPRRVGFACPSAEYEVNGSTDVYICVDIFLKKKTHKKEKKKKKRKQFCNDKIYFQ